MTRFPHLFNYQPDEESKALARREHPQTSKQAAAEAIVEGSVIASEARALTWVISYPGQTASELEQLAEVRGRVFGRRMVGLVRKGKISRGAPKRCAITGKAAATWWPVQAPKAQEGSADV